MNSTNSILICQAGRLNYASALTLQEKLNKLVANEKIREVFLLVEHNPVFTYGKNSTTEHLLITEQFAKENNIELYNVGRGGNITYHGPGQIVGYPILNLRKHKLGPKKYVHKLEKMLRHTLKEYNINGHIDPEYIGIWINNAKIAALGVQIKERVSMHGFAFNVQVNLKYFDMINPCGITNRKVTSLAKELGYNISIDEIEKKIIKHFQILFDSELEFINLIELMKL